LLDDLVCSLSENRRILYTKKIKVLGFENEYMCDRPSRARA